jgi:hypothetical protein
MSIYIDNFNIKYRYMISIVLGICVNLLKLNNLFFLLVFYSLNLLQNE